MALVPYIPGRDFDAELCTEFPRIEQVTAFLVVWIRNHFSDPQNMIDPSLQRKLWSATDTRGGVIIEDAGVWEPTKAGQRPAVLVSRQDYNIQRQIIDDRMQGVPELTGTRYYMNMAEGKHTVVAVSPLQKEADLYGMDVYRELNGFAPSIRANFGFTKFQVINIGAPTKAIKEYGSHWAVPITLDIAFQQTWRLVPQAPLLKTLAIEYIPPQ